MNYTITQKTKTFTLILMAIGLLSIVYGALDSHVDGTRIWSNVLVNAFYFSSIALFGTFFIAVQYVSQAGWSAQLKRIPEAMGSFLPYGLLILVAVLVASAMHLNHIYHWMDSSLYDKTSEHYDEIIAGKKPFLNIPFFFIRTAVYVLGWIMFTRLFRKLSLAEDANGGLEYYKKGIKIGAWFLVFFAITSSTSAWDWIMSIDTHWFSTLFGWYVFSGLFVSGIVMMILITLHLKQAGYLPNVNENHLHDLGKFMFAFSVFWTYLWFSQFLLIWYSNIPEEVTYFMDRFANYKVLFFANLIINFLFPFLVLMTRDAKRNAKVMRFVAMVLLVGHWLDVFLMVMPGAMKDHWGMGIVEIGTFLGFLGMFLFVTLQTLTKAALVPKNHPFIEESVHHHVM